MTRHSPSPSRLCAGFSLLELLVVASLCAILFTSGSLAYRAVAQNQRRATTFQEVNLTAAVASNFFPGTTETTIDSYTAPNFGRATMAEQMRNLFYEDVESSIAVFPLPRAGNLNSIRERVITTGTRVLSAYDTPEKFLELLLNLTATSGRAAVFRTYRGAPAESVVVGVTVTPVVNASIFLLQPSGSMTEMWLRAVYEVDYVSFKDFSSSSSGLPCVHASVRRYVDNVLTNYYDIVYRDAQTGDVGIPFVHFEKAIRQNVVSGTEANYTKWKAAGNQPFYLLWWPDPAMARLQGTSLGSYTTGSIRTSYSKHEGQTSFTFVVPQFPVY